MFVNDRLAAVDTIIMQQKQIMRKNALKTFANYARETKVAVEKEERERCVL